MKKILEESFLNQVVEKMTRNKYVFGDNPGLLRFITLKPIYTLPELQIN